jgi:hypothetical protein
MGEHDPGPGQTMASPQGDLGLLRSDLARPAHLAEPASLVRLASLPCLGGRHVPWYQAAAARHEPPQVAGARPGGLAGLGGRGTAGTVAAAARLLVALVQLPGALWVALGKGKVDPLAGLGQLLPPKPRSRARLRHPCPALALRTARSGAAGPF